MSNTNSSPSHDPYQYLAQGMGWGDAANRLLLRRARQRIVQLLKGQRVLDVGCGTGNLSAMLVAAGCQVVGVDDSPTMISHAQRKRIAAEFQLMDATCLTFNEEFDAAVISIALHEMTPSVRDQVWASMRRAVRPRGSRIALDYTIPQSASLSSRIAHALIEQDERSLLTRHREHYENFQEFMRNGGLRAWIQKRGESVDMEYDYWGGTLALVVCCHFESA